MVARPHPGTRRAVALDSVLQELDASYKKFPSSFSSSHEARGIIDEEVEELHDAVRANDRNGARREATQLAAMALRTLIDLDLV